MSRPHPETISPTAHYTGYVWFAHGHSHEAFATRSGRLIYESLRLPQAALARAGMPTLEGMLLARHRLIDLRLARAIEAGEIDQIVEVAAGLSPRGWRFRTRYGDRIRYVEADLPGMIARKRRVLAALGGETAHHHAVEIDALADAGPASIDAVCGALDPSRGTAILTEGLVNYFDTATVLAMWRRFAAALGRFPRGLYLSDLILRPRTEASPSLRASILGPMITGFSWLLSAFVRGRVHLHFDHEDHAIAELDQLGIDAALLDPCDFVDAIPDLEPAGASQVKILEASPR